MRHRQLGVSGFFIAILLLSIAGGIIAISALFGTSSAVDRSSLTSARFEKVRSALEDFAGVSARLPCPADPAFDNGDEVRSALAATCTVPAGILPWKTLGIQREDSIDAWGGKISYRVYTGTAGSLTQDGGVSMVDCDTNEALSAGPTVLVGSTGGLCRNTRDTREDSFLAGKGLRVNDFGVAVNDAAYVLISHGPSGLGAYTPQGGQKTPLPASADERTNILNVDPAVAFVARAASAQGVGPDDAAHFDDLLSYRKLAEVVKRAHLNARNWPDTVLASTQFNTPTLTDALGSAPPAGDIGRQTIEIYNATVTGFNSGGNQNLTFNQTNGNEGIGGSGSGGASLSSAGNEGIRLELTQLPKAAKFAVTLNDFGTYFGGAWKEQVEFRFFDGSTLKSTIIKQGCQVDGGLASFSIDAGSDFTMVEIRSLDTTLGFGFSFPSQFFLSEFRACLAGATCETSLQTPANFCP